MELYWTLNVAADSEIINVIDVLIVKILDSTLYIYNIQ